MDKIQEILKELYKIDPKLQAEEEKLRPIIEKMIEIKPNTRFNEKFRIELRNKLIDEIHEIRRKKEQKRLFINLSYFISGLALASFVFMITGPNIFKIVEKSKQEIVLNSNGTEKQIIDTISPNKGTNEGYLNALNSTGTNNSSSGASNTGTNISNTTIIKDVKNISSQKNGSNQSLLAFNIDIKKDKDSAFGIIKGDSFNSTSGKGGGNVQDTSFQTQQNPNSLKAIDTGFIQPDSSIKYTYKGDKIEIKESKMEVMKKEIKPYTNIELNNLMKSIKLDILDITKLESLFVNNITVSEDKKYGLQMNINLDEGNISLYKNWKQWPQNTCNTDECYAQSKIKLEQIPSDEKLINIANETIKKYGINNSNYSNPHINKDWLKTYNEAQNKNDIYLPESISVVYPLKIQGKTIYEESGYSKGLTMTIDVKSQKVQEIYGLEKLNFLSSTYEIENDFNKILEIATKGGRNGQIFYMKSGENNSLELSIGTPTLEYVYIYDYQNGSSEEYIVPAYIFPILDKPNEGYYGPEKIVVPLIKDLYK